MSVRLAVYPSHQITAQDYALQAERSLSSGIFYGGVVTISDSTTLHITSGVGIAHGRIFDITSEDITVELSTGSTLHGRLYVHVDLADADTPISLLTEVAASLSTLTQDEDMNESSGVWEMELATFDVSTTEISNLSYTAPGVSALGSDNIATVEAGTTATQVYTAGEYVVVGGQLYIVTSAIAIGDTFTVGTNITATTVGTELSELNSRLTELENEPKVEGWTFITNVTYTGTSGSNSVDVTADISDYKEFLLCVSSSSSSSARDIHMSVTVPNVENAKGYCSYPYWNGTTLNGVRQGIFDVSNKKLQAYIDNGATSSITCNALLFAR